MSFLSKCKDCAVGDCGYIRTRGFTIYVPVPAVWVRIGYTIDEFGSGMKLTGTSLPFVTRKNGNLPE